MNMNMNAMPAMPKMGPEANSLFAVIQGGQPGAMKAINDVFQQVLGYNQEQMEEMAAALENAEDLESPMEILEEWMQGLQDLLSQLGVQLEEQGFKMNSKAFAENMISIDGQEIKTIEDLQAALEGAADQASIPVFIQTQMSVEISISQKGSELLGEEASSEDLNQMIRLRQFSASIDVKADEAQDQLTLLATQIQILQNPNMTEEGQLGAIQNALGALQTLAKQFLAMSDRAEAPLQSAIQGDESWAIEAAKEGFTPEEIQLLAQMKDQVLVDLENQDTPESALSPEEQAKLVTDILGAAREELHAGQNSVKTTDSNEATPTAVLASEINTKISEAIENKDGKGSKGSFGQENPKEQASEDSKKSEEPRKGGAFTLPQVDVSKTHVVEEHSFTQVKTDSKGDLVIEKVVQTHTPNAPKHPVVRQVQTHVQMMFDKGESRSSLTLYPENLGKVDVEISIRNHKMELMVNVDNDKVKAVLESNLNQLRDQLAQNNLHLDKSEVNIGYKNGGSQNQNAGHNHQPKNRNAHTQDTLLQVEIQATEGMETGRRLGYNSMEYLA